MGVKKPMNKKVIIIISIVVAVLVVIGIVFVSFVSDFSQRATIGAEMEKINETGSVDTQIYSSGKYAEVEKALKDYVTEYQSVFAEITAEYQNEKIISLLSADNYKNDGPEFKESLELISTVQTKGENAKTRFTEMVTDDYKERRATDCNLTGKYKDLFMSSIQLDGELKDIETSIDNTNNYLSKIADVLNYLKENKDNWELSDGKIKFKELSQLTKYNSLLTSVNTAAGVQ